MQRYQHRFDTVQGYLHHRSPYLLIDRIESIQPSQIITSATVVQDSFYGQGHFPGTAILPGALMQEMTTQSAGILIAAEYNPMEEYRTEDPFFNRYALGVLVKVHQARYRSFARPGDELTIRVSLDDIVGDVFDFKGEIVCGDRLLTQNTFRLTNILSSTLQGKDPDPASVSC